MNGKSVPIPGLLFSTWGQGEVERPCASRNRTTENQTVIRGWVATKDGKPVKNQGMFPNEFSIVKAKQRGWLRPGEKWTRAELRLIP